MPGIRGTTRSTMPLGQDKRLDRAGGNIAKDDLHQREISSQNGQTSEHNETTVPTHTKMNGAARDLSDSGRSGEHARQNAWTPGEYSKSD